MTWRIVCLIAVMRIASAQTAEVRGRAVDAASASIAHASVRLKASGENSATFSGEADSWGAFAIRNMLPGNYTLRVWVSGFRPRTLSVSLNASEVKNLGEIRLEVLGCDAPGVNCDSFGEPLPPDKSRGNITLQEGWSADLDRGRVFQAGTKAAPPDVSADVILLRDSHLWKLAPLHGATISQSDCESARFDAAPIQLNELDSSDEICVKTDRRNYAHLFVLEKIGPEGSLRLWHVTH